MLDRILDSALTKHSKLFLLLVFIIAFILLLILTKPSSKSSDTVDHTAPATTDNVASAAAEQPIPPAQYEQSQPTPAEPELQQTSPLAIRPEREAEDFKARREAILARFEQHNNDVSSQAEEEALLQALEDESALLSEFGEFDDESAIPEWVEAYNLSEDELDQLLEEFDGEEEELLRNIAEAYDFEAQRALED